MEKKKVNTNLRAMNGFYGWRYQKLRDKRYHETLNDDRITKYKCTDTTDEIKFSH